jgi:hypothetical protein
MSDADLWERLVKNGASQRDATQLVLARRSAPASGLSAADETEYQRWRADRKKVVASVLLAEKTAAARDSAELKSASLNASVREGLAAILGIAALLGWFGGGLVMTWIWLGGRKRESSNTVAGGGPDAV